jgi:hypothetical protein
MSKIANCGCELNVVKCGKYSLAKFCILLYTFVLRAGIATKFGPKIVAISARNT